MTSRSVVIVGAGLGGLATAVRLASVGYEVTVVEKNQTSGGRCNRLERDGFTFDTGPTLLLMRDVIEELFMSAGRRLEDYLDLIRVDPNYRIHFGDGSSLDMTGNFEQMEEALERFSPGSVPGFRRYVDDAGFKYTVGRERFVERNFLRLRDFATVTNLKFLMKTNTLRNLDRHASHYFEDARLRAAFTFQTMYLGLAPSSAPAVYSLLVYTELMEGIWFPRGGMYQIVLALERLARELGVQFEYGAGVRSITTRDNRAIAVETENGSIAGDIVVSNADLPYTYSALLPSQARGAVMSARLQHLNYGSSAYLLFIAANGSHSQGTHHTVYLSGNVTANYRAVFKDRSLPADPSLYVCVPSRTDPSMAPAGKDGVYVLVPVPHTSPGVDWKTMEPEFRQRVLSRLESIGEGRWSDASFIEVMTPDDLTRLYNLARGSAFGLSHGLSQVGYMRPANKAPRLDNLYFCGASTVPGGGVPMVTIGSRLTAERIMADHPHG